MDFFIIIIIIFIIVVAALSGDKGGVEKKLPYVKKDYFLTKAELDFFRILEKAIENKYYIFPQANLSDLLFVKTKKAEYYKYRNKIDRKSVDFVLVEKENLKPLLVIELDDNSHSYRKRRERDNFVEKAFKDAGLTLLRIGYRRNYDAQELSNTINNAIDSNKELSDKSKS
jgi:very-short-patch-repair endonuclease